MKTQTHTQVKMRRGSTNTVSWIPSAFAIKGKFLKLDNEGVREDGWQVVATGTTLPSHVVMERERDHKRHMEADGRIRKAQ